MSTAGEAISGDSDAALTVLTPAPAAIYDAFISYSHAKDKPVAAALQSLMQRLGKPWYRRRALRIFRDDTSLAAAPELWPAIEQALSQSRYLILLASPEAARSLWVSKEVAYWLAHRSRRTVLIAVTSGELTWLENDFRWDDTTPLPPLLKARFAHEPKWIDLRGHRDAPDQRDAALMDAAADLAAVIRGMRKEDLVSQELRQQRRALTLAWSAALVLFALAGAAVWQWAEAEQQKRVASQQRDQAEHNLAVARKVADDLVSRIASGLRTTRGMRLDVVRQILDSVQVAMDDLLRASPDDKRLLFSRGRMLREFAIVYGWAGDYARAKAATNEGIAVLRRLVVADPQSTDFKLELAVLVSVLGDWHAYEGENEQAHAAFEECVALLRAAIVIAPESLSLQRTLALALGRLGGARIILKNPAGAVEVLEEGVGIMRRVIAATPDHAFTLLGLAAALDRLSDVRWAMGDRHGAMVLSEEALTIVRRMATLQPENLQWQREISAALNKIGDLRKDGGDKAGALVAYEESLAIMRRLVSLAADNVNYQLDLARILDKMSGAVEVARARTLIQEAIEILEAMESAGTLTSGQKQWIPLLRAALAKIQGGEGER